MIETMSDLHAALQDAAEPEPPMSVAVFHAMLDTATKAAWRGSNLPLCYAEVYNLMECGFRAAMPDRIPPLPEDVR